MMTSNIFFRQIRNPIKYAARHQSSKSEVNFPRKIFSGIQPTGQIHLGNYLGAVAQWVKMQNNNEDMILSIVDLHSMTLPHNPKELSKNIIEMTATLIGCGIDPNKVILFQQSRVSAHTELCWNLGCISTMARLAHLSTYKDKSSNLKDIPLGLFVYPVLQAADILAYKATHVPCGEDQIQHIELTQELSRMFNRRFGNTFPHPQAVITGTEYARLKSLRDPVKKMSKSDPDPKSRLCLLDKPDNIVNNLKKAVTDNISEVFYNPKDRPGVSNIISIHSFITNKPIDEICRDVKDLNTGQYKLLVADAVISHLKPIQDNIAHLIQDPQHLLNVLKDGAEKASTIAENTMTEVRQKLGTQPDINAKIKEQIKA